MMAASENRVTVHRRLALECYAGVFVVACLSLLPEPTARATDVYGASLAALPLRSAKRFPHQVTGLASYYHPSLQGLPTASLTPYNEEALTAAHRTLPLGTVVRVTNEVTGRFVDVTINDRGPYVPGRVIDLSKRAAQALGMVHDGVAPVRLRVLRMGRERGRS